MTSRHAPFLATALLSALCLLASSCTKHHHRSSTVSSPITPGFGIDSDGDGLDDLIEIEGWDIAVDSVGFGPGASSNLLELIHVTSDPLSPDTDGDGLDDLEEFAHKTNPNFKDTDGDGLDDDAEINIWKTSPVSVDTDGDARGPDPALLLPPKADLFDGHELIVLGTSPSLADTDGDNKTDYEEYDDALRNARIAELPQVSVEFEGAIDIRLKVTYAETEGTLHRYGSSFATTTGSSTSNTSSTSIAVTKEADKGGLGMIGDIAEGASMGGFKGAAMVIGKQVGEVAFSAGCDALGVGGSGTPQFDMNNPLKVQDDSTSLGQAIESNDARSYLDASGLCAPATPETTTTMTNSLTRESSRSATEEYSEYQQDSRERTETTASGSVKVGARITNEGLFAFELSDLFITMTQWESNPGPDAGLSALGTGGFRTLATLLPVANQSFILGPGASTSVVELEDIGINPSIIKQFLKRPTAIFYQPAGFELSNAQGIDFQFLTEKTFAQTATVVIEYGDGRSERYAVATNVARHAFSDPDGAFARGDLAGITMGEVMKIIGVPHTTTRANRMVNGALMEVDVLDTVRGLGNVFPMPSDPLPLPPKRSFDGTQILASPHSDVLVGPELGGPTAFWTIHSSAEEGLVGVGFNNLVLRHGDSLRLLYVHDRDGDGLYSDEESIHGSVDSAVDVIDNSTGLPLPGGDGIPDSVDSDGDLLTDFMEVKHGWRVGIDLDGNFSDGLAPQNKTLEEWNQMLPLTLPPSGNLPSGGTVPSPSKNVYYWAYSNPAQQDADGDGLSDMTEFSNRLDPNNPDTDDDGIDDLSDSENHLANTPANRLYVSEKTGATSAGGSSWQDAFLTIGAAVSDAKTKNENSDPLDDVAQIWVASGRYVESIVVDTENLQLYGGFQGIETKLDQRDANALTNATVISGDVNGDDTGGWTTYDDNHPILISAEASSITISGFELSGASESAIEFSGQAAEGTVSDCLFRANDARTAGGAAVWAHPSSSEASNLTLRDCVFTNNRGMGGTIVELSAAVVKSSSPRNILLCDGCTFEANDGCEIFFGDPRFKNEGELIVRDCEFLQNTVLPPVPGLATQPAIIHVPHNHGYDVTLERVVFDGNRVESDIGSIQTRAIVRLDSPQSRIGRCTILQCQFRNNSSGASAGNIGASILAVTSWQNVSVLNSTFTDNRSDSGAVSLQNTFNQINSFIRNCVLWGNDLKSGGSTPNEGSQIVFDPSTTHLDIRNSCVMGLSRWEGHQNIDDDPMLTATDGLSAGSPCIDVGNTLIDFDPMKFGIQGPPALDKAGQPRVTDGDGDGKARIDMGAFEFQPPVGSSN